VVWSVNKNSENVEAAWDFMMWMATSEEGSTLMAAAGYPVPYPDSMTMGGYPKQIVDVYFTPPDPAWQPQIIMPWDHPCGWDGAIGPFMSNTLPEILDSPADQVAEILHRGAVDAQAAWDSCVELLEAGE
jgi:ABC-type glycerol-3-phosphate transport system substrate-binding protein